VSTVSISAHRGGSEHSRPATYEAYRRSVTSGAEYVEFDIRKTRDDILVVYHDARCAHDGPLVADTTYKSMCEKLGYTVPRVDEVMELLAGKVMGHLDLKDVGYEDRVIRLALETFGPGNFVATTLEDVSIARIKRDFPRVRTALSLGRDLGELPRYRWVSTRYSELRPLRRLRACSSDWVAVNYRIGRRGVLDQCMSHQIAAMVWTVDDDALIDRFIVDPRVTVLITNRPEFAVARRDALAAGQPARGSSSCRAG
jgi:glycerophosphoryl diester phosphodiesterase